MQLSVIVAVLAALIIAENSPPQPVSEVGLRLFLILALIAAVGAVAAIGSRRLGRRLAQMPEQRYWLVRKFRRLRQVHSLLWMAGIGATLYGLGWARIVRFNWHLDGVPVVDDILVLAPVVLPMILSWAGFYEFDRALQTRLPSHDGTQAPPATTRRQYVGLQLRHCLGLLLLPIPGLVAIQDMACWLVPELLDSSYGLAIYLLPVVLLFLFFPTLLRYTWQTRPLGDAALQNRLEAAARRAHFRCRKILVWHTNGTLINAAVAGFLPPLRYVFLTDGLITHLSDAEIEAVFGHEVGHVRHRHLALRVAAMIAPVSLWLLIQQLCPTATGRLEEQILQAGLNVQAALGLLMLGAMTSYGAVVFGSYSRLLEGQADLFGCRSLSPPSDDSSLAVFVNALEKLAATSGIDRNAASWQHASIARRVEFLERTSRDPGYERAFHRRVFWLSSLFLAIAISPLVYLAIP